MNHIEISKMYSKIAYQYVEKRLYLQPKEELDNFYKKSKYLNDFPTLLDAGCGPGRDIKSLLSFGSNIFGIDISEEFIKIARKENPKAKISKQNILTLDFPNEFFHGIWCCAVLSHIERNKVTNVLKGFYKILKKKGIIHLIVRKGTGEETVEDCFKGIHRYFVNFNEKEICKLLKNVGFINISYEVYNEKNRFGNEYRDIDFISITAFK